MRKNVYHHICYFPFHCARYLSTASIAKAESSHQYTKDIGDQSENHEENEETNRRLRASERIARYIHPSIKRLFRGESNLQQVQSNAGMVHERGGEEYFDPDVPVEKLLEDAPNKLRRETKILSKQLGDSISTGYYILGNPKLYTNVFGAESNEGLIQFQFKTEKDMKQWQTGCDSDNSEGYSKCDLYKSDRGTAIFEGVLSKRVVKDGRNERAGWCAMRSDDTAAFLLKKRFRDWSNYNQFMIKVRGDGRSYKIMLHNSFYFDVTWGNSHSFPLHTHGGPYWQYEVIPFSRFIHTCNGRIVDAQMFINASEICSVGITIMDKIEGPFRLEIDFIGVLHNPEHKALTDYETFNSPLYNTDA